MQIIQTMHATYRNTRCHTDKQGPTYICPYSTCIHTHKYACQETLMKTKWLIKHDSEERWPAMLCDIMGSSWTYRLWPIWENSCVSGRTRVRERESSVDRRMQGWWWGAIEIYPWDIAGWNF